MRVPGREFAAAKLLLRIKSSEARTIRSRLPGNRVASFVRKVLAELGHQAQLGGHSPVPASRQQVNGPVRGYGAIYGLRLSLRIM